MAIQWYPGHMHKARKEIEEVMPQIDLVIEVLDARIPYSSENPMVAKLRQDKPCIKLLNKSDLADPEITNRWIEYLEQEQGVRAQAITTLQPAMVRKIPELCRKLVPVSEGALKDIRTMIMGIPNVGKSTIINTLAGRVIAKTGNEPAVTKAQQRINLKNGIVLSDTPGILWPKVDNEASGYRLAVTGAIKDTAMEYEDVALFAAAYFLHAYPEAMMERYKLTSLPATDIELLEEIGRRRGALRSGGHIDLHKASELLLHEFRSGKIGQLSLETPEMAQAEEAEVAKLLAEKEALKQAKKEADKLKRAGKRHQG
ncbi:ribosome biogenesis GTPase YlqF [Shewanella indica]|jgi:ribosome biogenesis GTPase A|uniref:Ribosome biogenesis GTPase A n=1 Tax=Shewanella indica TaxID=768528 RepID=A0ABU4QH23_9GAMM|nr:MULTISPECIES: ribosome biogenesis GTPase YlqF [Shewanella]MBO2628525.1 ribosome biogenesis GTPase YlqF [Shewanella algae]MBZ4678201.1 ribosome biosis GTPase YlqF [Shewanella sp.]MCA0950028.1 ribosome biogenesis GTPase YlqF [Shewanella chilikensis]MCE9791330.1 ribosome biogenesis GTPase YlqF [Shewanella indica]MDX6018141.1 ribosome biogenesis GTPase YlqF [Shewanella indica]